MELLLRVREGTLAATDHSLAAILLLLLLLLLLLVSELM